MAKNVVCCLSCKSTISVNNLAKHQNSKRCKSGLPPLVPVTECPHCRINSSEIKNMGSHIKWCKSNPNVDKYKLMLAYTRDQITASSRKKQGQSIKQKHLNGDYSHLYGRTTFTEHTQSTKDLISQKARISNHQRKCKFSHQYIDKNGREFIFDSSWEDALADRLDDLDIVWTRPAPITYTDLFGKLRKYYPDFYLPVYDLYLDPKNSYAESCQIDKLEIVSKIINLIILRSISDCRNFTLKK